MPTPARAFAIVSVVLGLAACSGATGTGLDLVSHEQEREMGLEAWQEIRSGTPVSGDEAYQRRAQAVARRVLVAAGEDPSQWEVVVFRSDEVNAFALPGNKIGIYEGMMKTADTDEQLAAVLGHEVAHDQRHHAAERMSSDMATQLGVNIASVALGSQGSALASLLGAGAQYGVLLPYSRNQELEADRLGLHTMAKAGYNPEAAITLWQKMESRGGTPPTFLSTHPAPGDRIRQLRAQMPEAEAEYRAARPG